MKKPEKRAARSLPWRFRNGDAEESE